ncbi:hypothetical protein K1T71_006394 [Dendrolimus kikuchii]|uniref:Uncharacterized protein n=2 Tax=Dendrolimus kikuchii TaxID=765133 RepID=A0ACC1D3Z4_9NEOP|nr:hypothetical protein K1T71_013430 [Dendrolimus kikuchii]KAJ0178571.1 hypothetical protein K1T71_006394 [Dendrolimus kikuchii]
MTSPQSVGSQPTKKVTLTFSPPSRRLPNRTYIKTTPPKAEKYKSRETEAKACMAKVNLHLGNSRNLKTEIKQGVQNAVDRLHALFKESEGELEKALADKGRAAQGEQAKRTSDAQTQTQIENQERPVMIDPHQIVNWSMEEEDKAFLKKGWEDLALNFERQAELLKKVTEEMNNYKEVIQKHVAEGSEAKEVRRSYASVAAVRPGVKPPTYRTLHSVAVSSGKENASADEVLKEVREALNARQGGIEVERVRKARDGRVIISCRSPEEREKLKQKLSEKKARLTAEDITNKQPMVMITGVLRSHTDDDLFEALRNQNELVFEGLEEGDDRMEVAYKIRGRNPNTHRVIMKVSPPLWRRMVDTGTVRVDLQTLQVTDRSPLTQCTICLGFGHGKKLCTETQVMCSHCGGPHTRNECEEYTVGAPPKCKNCTREKKAEVDHNAFSETCPVRARWDAIVRATVAYC